MDDDIDIYEDLPSFDAEKSEKHKEEIKDLSQKCKDFQQENTELKLKVAELSESNNALSVNLSSLLKTAKAEISRKDRMITELRQQVDNMAFRRTRKFKPKAQGFPTNPTKNNTHTSSIKQEPFPNSLNQSIPYQDNTNSLYIQQESFSVSPTQSISHQEFEEEIEDPDQKYEPEKIATTVFGERLRKKILLEQEVERIQKEEAKRAMLENAATIVKTEVETIQENKNATDVTKNEIQEAPHKVVEEAAVSSQSGPASNGSSLNSYEEDDRNLAERRDLSKKVLGKRLNEDISFPSQKRRRIDDETYYSDDMRYYNGNAPNENRFHKKINDHCRNPRNTGKYINRRRGSDNRDDIERDRRTPGERSKSNYRSRSRSPDRRYVEKRADRHRTDKYRAYMDTYEKRRHNGLNRNNAYSNKYNKDAHNLREKINHRSESKIGVRNEYNNYKNNKLEAERKRGRRKSPPPVKSRTRSNGKIRGKPADKIEEGRSKSSNSLTNSLDKASESENMNRKSKHRKMVVDGFKIEKSPRASCEKQTTDKKIVSSALLLEVFEKENTDKIHISSAVIRDVSDKKDTDEMLSSALFPNVAEEKDSDEIHISSALFPDILEQKQTDKQHISTVQSPKVFETKEMDTQNISTSLLPDVFEKKAIDTLNISTSLLPDDSVPILKSENTKSKSKDLTIIGTKKKKSQISSKESSEEEVTKKNIASSQPLPDASEKEVTNETVISSAQLSSRLSSDPKSCELPEESKKQTEITDRSSKDSELSISEQKNPESTLKQQISSRKSFENEVTLLVSLELLPDDSKKEATNLQVIPTSQLPDSSASAPESYKAPEILKNRTEIRKKSKDSESTITEEKNCDPESKSQTKSKQSFGREIRNKQLNSIEQSLVDSAPNPCKVLKEIKIDRKSAKRKSKDSQTSIAEDKNRASKAKSQLTSRKNFEKESTNEKLASSAPSAHAFKDQVTNQQRVTSTKLLDDLEKSSEVPEEIKKQRMSSRTKSKIPAVMENKIRNPKPKSSLTKTSCENEVMDKKLAMTTESPDIVNIASESYNASEELNKQPKSGSKTSKDPKSTVTTVKNCSLELKCQSPTRTNFKEAETNEHLVSNVPTVEDLISKLESDGISDEQKVLNDVNTKPVASLEIAANQINNADQSITSVLENDAEIASIPVETPTDVGSRSFREEKIENIEKFIQNYQHDEDLCCQFPKNSSDDLECRNKSCDSINSILDTLSMDIDIAYSKPGQEVLDNSLISEQLLLESLSTPIKKKNLPLLSLPPLNTIKSSSLPSNSPPKEMKQPPLPLNSPPEDTEQPPLPPNSPPAEMEMKSLLLLQSSDKNPTPLPSLDEKKQILPSLPFLDDMKQNFSQFPSPEEKTQNLLPLSSPEEQNQNFMSSSSPEEKNEKFPASPSSEEKKQNFPPLPFSEDKEQILPLPLLPNESKQSPPSLLSPNIDQQARLPYCKTENQELPPLPSSDKEKRFVPPLKSSNDEKQRLLSPHPSPDHRKRRLLASLLSLDQEKQQLSLSRTSAASAEEMKPDSLLVLAPQTKNDQLLSLTAVDEPKSALLAQLTPIEENDRAPTRNKGEESELSVISLQSQKEDLLLSQVESDKANSQLSSPVLIQKEDLSSSLPPVRHENANLELSALPALTTKNDERLLANRTDEKNEASSQSAAPADGKLLPTVTGDKNPQASVEINEKSQPPVPTDTKTDPPIPADKKSEPPIPANKKSEPPIPTDKKSGPPIRADKKSEPPIPADKKSQFAAPDDKNPQTSVEISEKSQPPISADEKTADESPPSVVNKSLLPAPTDKKSEPLIPVDKKSQLTTPVDEKSQLLTRSKTIDLSLALTENNLLLSALSGKKDVRSAPTAKINKISQMKETVIKKSEPEKPQPQKVTLKAISRRHRIFCTPIVSRYSRKTRDLVLTDSAASLCLVKLDTSSDNKSINNANVKIETSPCITKEAKIILKQIETTKLKDTTSEKSISNSISKIIKPEKLSTDLNICSTENARKNKSNIPNATSELQQTKKLHSVPEIISPKLSGAQILNSEQFEYNSGKSQSQLESKQEVSSKSQNSVSNSEIEKLICPKAAESRGTRLALKTIATSGSGDDSSSVSANLKKTLPKEKENHSKQVGKPCKIIVVARRRRPVTLEDSSTATTLVTSAQETNCDRPSRSNCIKNIPLNSEEPEFIQKVSDPGNKGRKRRSADK